MPGTPRTATCGCDFYVATLSNRGLSTNGTENNYKDFLPLSIGIYFAATMKIKMQYYKRSYWNILFRTKMKDARKILIR
jgi:hypothetical protein